MNALLLHPQWPDTHWSFKQGSNREQPQMWVRGTLALKGQCMPRQPGPYAEVSPHAAELQQACAVLPRQFVVVRALVLYRLAQKF